MTQWVGIVSSFTSVVIHNEFYRKMLTLVLSYIYIFLMSSQEEALALYEDLSCI